MVRSVHEAAGYTHMHLCIQNYDIWQPFDPGGAGHISFHSTLIETEKTRLLKKYM
jgi:hypothetical protein